MVARRLAATFLFAVIGTAPLRAGITTQIVVSVAEQELGVIERGKLIARYPVSTSKFGVGDSAGSYRTPLGTLFISGKVGEDLPAGSVIKSRLPTGEVLAIDAAGRDAIVSRVIWLRGMEKQNRAAHERCIYIHGTPEERRLEKPASYGCIRMRSRDIIALYPLTHVGMHVTISTKHLADFITVEEPSLFARTD